LSHGQKQGRTSTALQLRRTTRKGETSEKERIADSRRELLEKALDAVARDLDKPERPANAVANLVQLLKLERLLTEDEEQPHEIRVVWQETDDETDESATNSDEN
jgi:hypothetical protein